MKKKFMKLIVAVVAVALGLFALKTTLVKAGGIDITIADTPPIMEKLLATVAHPDQIDEATKKFGVPARLLNFHLATPADLSSIGLDNMLHIPVAISKNEGGRKSLYYLEPGEEVLAGIFVSSNEIALRYIKRETGSGTPAQTGDIYSLRITTRDGEVVFEDRGELEIIEPRIGHGQVNLKKSKVDVWILWSCIRVRTETE